MQENKVITQEAFLLMFSQTRFRYIHEVNKQIHVGSNILDLSWNKKGFGTYFTVNGFPSTGEATIATLQSLNANFIDMDIGKDTLAQEERSLVIQERLMDALNKELPMPTIIVRTKNGAHLYWLYTTPIISPNDEQKNQWASVQNKLVGHFDGDKNAKDLARILRVPFTDHLKDPHNPFPITISSYKPQNNYTLQELDRKIPLFNNTYSSTKTSALETLFQGVPIGKGLRHEKIAQVAGLLLRFVKTPEEIIKAKELVYVWDREIVKSPEPFLHRKKEIDDTFNSIGERELANRKKEIISPESKLELWSTHRILSHDFGEEEWLVDSLISKQGITALSGNPGDYKTWLSIHIALSVSRNGQVFGKFQCTKGGVLVIDEEDHLRLIKKRLKSLGVKDDDTIYYLSQSGIKVDEGKYLDLILNIIKEKSIKLVIFDSLVRVHGQDENEAKGMARVFMNLQKITKEGASILFTHHHRKQFGFSNNNPGQSMRGSSDILAAVDCHITVEKKRDEENRLIVRQTKLRQAELVPTFEVNILTGELGPSGFEFGGDYNESKHKIEAAIEVIIYALSDGMKSRQEIIEGLKEEEIGKTTTENALKLAESEKKIERVPKEELLKEQSRKAYYRLPGSNISPKLDLPASSPI